MTQHDGGAQLRRFIHRAALTARPAPVGFALKRIFGVKREVLTDPLGSFWIDPASNLGFALKYEGSYESDTCNKISALLKPGDTFVDLGANEGFFTVLGAKLCGPSGRVIAIEPQERLTHVITRNLELNGITNAEILRLAISDTEGTRELFLSFDVNTGSSSFFKTTRYPVPRETVTTKSLTSVCRDLGLKQINLLKIDIEGAEHEAIAGAADLLAARKIKAIILEQHPAIDVTTGHRSGDIASVLAKSSYSRSSELDGVWLAPN